MKNTFKEYHQYTEKEFKELWENCLFVFDTNTLLNMYRYSRETVEIYFKVLEKLKKNKQLWIPYQVGYEFHENRINVIFEYEKSYDEILSILEVAKNDIQIKYKDHPFLDLKDINQKVKKGLSSTETAIKKAKQDHPKWLESDDVLEKINKLFQDNIGENYDEKKLSEIKKEGALRYDKKIPPGFKDIKKDEEKRYGDLILWYQIIDKAKELQKPIVFISGDVKEDWWLEKSGKRIMPLPKLKKEMYEKANVDFHIYTADLFLKLSKTDENKINEDIIKEVRKIRESEEKRIMMRRRKLLDRERIRNPLSFERHSIDHINFIEKAEKLVNEINEYEIDLRLKHEINHILHRLLELRNIYFHEDNNKKIFNKMNKYQKEILHLLQNIIHTNNISSNLSNKIIGFIHRFEAYNY